MVSLRLGVVVLIACGACGAANSGSEGKVVVSHGDGGSAIDGATRGASRPPQDAGARDAVPRDARPPEAGIDAAPPATWTAIYQNLLVNQSYPSNCTGSSCHDPGIEKGLDLSTSHLGLHDDQPSTGAGLTGLVRPDHGAPVGLHAGEASADGSVEHRAHPGLDRGGCPRELTAATSLARAASVQSAGGALCAVGGDRRASAALPSSSSASVLSALACAVRGPSVTRARCRAAAW